MLSLAGRLRFGRFTVYRDVVRREDRWAPTSRFYALADTPRLVRDAAGEPAFQFLWYRLPPSAPAAGRAGGLVTLSVDLGPSSAEREELAGSVRAALPAENLPSPEIVSLPVKSGTVELAFAGEAAEGSFARQIAGNGTARLSGAERASFVVDLTADGAALLAQAIEAGRDLFHARYDLVVEHRLADVQLRVWCDARRAHATAAAELAGGSLGPGALRESLIEKHLAGIEVTSEAPLAPEHRTALEALGAKLLQSALANALFTFEAVEGSGDGAGLLADGRGGRLRPWSESMHWSLNHTFAESYPAEQHVVSEDVLRLGREEASRVVHRIDLPSEAALALPVRLESTVDFERDPIDKVRVRLDYEGAGPNGPIVRTGEFVFDRTSSPTQTFLIELASRDQRRYRWEAEIFYRGQPEPLRLTPPPTDASTLVLDFDALGVLRVEVELRDVSFDTVRNAVVDLEYPSKALSHRLVLGSERPAGGWQAIVRERPRPYRYRVAWVTADGGRLEGDWQTSSSAQLALDAPAELSAAARVMLVAGGDFSDVAQIVVELRPAGVPGATPTELAFAQPGETQSWLPRTHGPVGFRYEFRRTVVGRDGARRTTGWMTSDAPVLVVRDDLRYEVRVVARRLPLGDTFALGLVTLEPLQGGSDRATLSLRSAAEEGRWSFRLSSPHDHRYRYQLTLIRRSGERITVPWQEAEEEILVLPPPS